MSNPPVKMKAVVVGAGLVGALLALLLRKKGFEVVIFERYPDARAIPALGRSINLVLTVRGIRALETIGEGLAEELIGLTVGVTGRSVHQQDGSQAFQRYGKDDSEYNYSISRYELNTHLINRAEKAGAHIHFNHQLTDYCPDSHTLTFEVGGSETSVNVSGSWIFGADGAGSPLRKSLQRGGLLDASEVLLPDGYKELLLPLTKQGTPPLSVHALHLWPRGSHMLMALPNKDGSFTGTLYMPNAGPLSFQKLNSPDAILRFFRQYYPDSIAVLGGEQRLVSQMLNNPVGVLGTVRCTRTHVDRVLLIGDAAHAVVPFYGQGTNCGFEDCLEIWQQIEEWERTTSRDGNRFGEYLERVDRARKPNSLAIADMALQNYEEMRDKVGNQDFLLAKAVENKLENVFPNKFRSEYAMVCYGGMGNVTYENAQHLGKINHQVLDILCRGIRSVDQVDLKEAEKLLDKMVVPELKEREMDLSTISTHSTKTAITDPDSSQLHHLSAKL